MTTVEQPTVDPHLELYAIMQQDIEFEQKAREALELGERYLGVENAHLTRIDRDATDWTAIASTDPSDGRFPPGLRLDLGTTYCRRVIERRSSVALHDAPEQGWADDPAFDAHGLRCYHGTPLVVDGEPYGTVCFVSEAARDRPFDGEETLFAELLARLLEHELERGRQERENVLRSNSITVLSRVLRHNLRNEMSVVRGRLSVLLDGLGEDGDPDVERTILRSVDRVIALSDKARKLEAVVSTQFERELIDVRPLLERVRTTVQADHPAATIEIDAPDVSIEATASLEIAVTELVGNAAKHAGEAPAVRLDVKTTAERLTLVVVDDGPGLPEQERAVLDDGAETPLVHGSGLGLWMVYWIVSSLGGGIETTVTDEGTAVTVTVPRTAAASAAATADGVRQFERGRDRFEAVFEDCLDAMILVRDDRTIVDANEHAGDVFGAPEQQVVGRTLDEFAGDGFDLGTAWLELQARGSHEGEFPLVRPDGTERVLEYSAKADVVPGQHLIVGRDVTARRERERQFEAIFNHSFQFTGLLEPDGTIVRANETALEFGGLEEDDVIGRKLWEAPWFQYGDAAERARHAVDRAADGEFVRMDLEVRGADRVTTIDFSVKPVADDDGSVEYLIPEGRDRSDR